MQERISLEQARAVIATVLAGKRPAIERCSTLDMQELLGRTLAETLYAPMALPPFANSAMDGYALRSADLDLPDGRNSLPLQGSALAGADAQVLSPGHCMRITTGAALPSGADCVVMQEQTLAHDGVVQFNGAVRPGNFVRHAGEDFQKDQLLLRAGARLGAAELALLHAMGLTSVRVNARPKVIILAGGDELRNAGTALGFGQIFESNRASLSALLHQLGAQVVIAPIMADQKVAIANALTQAASVADLVISTGGASVGDADFLPQLLRELGHVHFYRVRVKPGMPAIFAEVNNRPVLALPGNPVSVFISFLTLARPAVELLCGREPTELQAFTLPLAEAIQKSHPRREFLRAALVRNGMLQQVRALEGQGSAMLRGLLQADGLIDLPEGEAELAIGTRVPFIPFRGLLS
jgi:molybdopterin molybdotransferase